MTNKPNLQSVGHISIVLTATALILWSYSLTQAGLSIGFYGLISSFPISFFVALGMLTIASAILWVDNKNHQKLLLGQLLFLITALWLVPAVIGSHPNLGVAHRNLGLVSNIVEQGRILGAWYLSWPGAHVLFAIVSTVVAVDLEPVAGIFPFLMQLLWLLPLYVFLRNTLGKARVNYCWAGLWIFSLANWVGQEYFSPQAITFFLLLLLLALITSPLLWQEGSRPLPFLLAGGVIIAAIAITHFLTALAVACVLTAFCLAKRDKKLAPLIVGCLLFIVIWDVTGGGHYLSRFSSEPVVMDPSLNAWAVNPGGSLPRPGVAGPALVPQGVLAFDPGYIIESNVTMSLSGSESHIAVVRTRIVLSSIFAVLGLAGVILTLVKSKQKRAALSVLAMAMSLSLLLPLTKQFGWELIQRLYLYALPFLAYFGAMLLDLRRKISATVICLWLIAASPLFMIAHYGNQAKDYWSPGYAAGVHYVNEATMRSDYSWARLSQVGWQNNQLVFNANFPTEEHYLAISKYDDAVYDFLRNQPDFVDEVGEWLRHSSDYDRIYVNPEFSGYVKEY